MQTDRHAVPGRTNVMWITTLGILLALMILTGIAIARAMRETLPPVGAGYWHTLGTQILDENNRPVRIAGVTWYGMETSYWVPAGLDYQPYTKIMDLVKSLGFNTIRLAYSNELVETNPVVTQHVAANPALRGMHALTVLDRLVSYAHSIDLKIILDDHVSSAERPLHVNDLTEALWYTSAYPESSWIHDWETLARRYQNDDAIVGFDLRNEPHTDGPGPWTLQAYRSQGATWGPAGGSTDPSTDWRLAAERAGNAVLDINPRLLIFVEGLQLYPDPTAPNGVNSYWWGSILTPVRQYPVQLSVPHQLVYSPHDWGPRKYWMPWFRNLSYQSILRVWRRNWAFLLDHPTADYAAPIWIGEFGTCITRDTCIDRQEPDNQATWLHLLLSYLEAHPEVGWSFFALNGTNANNSVADNGLLNAKWDGVSSKALLKDLQSVQTGT